MIHRNLKHGGHFGVNHNHDTTKVLVQLQDRDEQVRCAFEVHEAETLIALLQEHLAIVKQNVSGSGLRGSQL